MNELLYPIVIPALAGVLVVFLPSRQEKFRNGVALIGAILACLFAAVLFSAKEIPRCALPWLEVGTFNFEIALRADALSRFMVLAANVFGVLVVLYSMSYMKGRERLREYYAYLMWPVAAANVALLADNLLLLVVGWEIVTLLLLTFHVRP